MGRPRKTDIPNTEEQPGAKAEATPEGQASVSCEVKEREVTPRILEIMRLYPQYEELWITPRGFVHPVGTPGYLLKDATLYKNQFYNK